MGTLQLAFGQMGGAPDATRCCTEPRDKERARGFLEVAGVGAAGAGDGTGPDQPSISYACTSVIIPSVIID
jgi:hypothetical protein